MVDWEWGKQHRSQVWVLERPDNFPGLLFPPLREDRRYILCVQSRDTAWTIQTIHWKLASLLGNFISSTLFPRVRDTRCGNFSRFFFLLLHTLISSNLERARESRGRPGPTGALGGFSGFNRRSDFTDMPDSWKCGNLYSNLLILLRKDGYFCIFFSCPRGTSLSPYIVSLS